MAEEKTGLQLSKKLEIGDIHTVGPYKGKPTIYGTAVLYPPQYLMTESDNRYPGLEWIVDQLILHINTLRDCGAEDIYLDIAVYYIGQCNLAFGPELLKRIADLNIPFWISCYEDYDEGCH